MVQKTFKGGIDKC